jgi:uncharacterized protein
MRPLIALGLLLICDRVVAHGIKCDQVFINKSERAICASPELMQLDGEMARLADVIDPVRDGFKAEQRDFRAALKRCKGQDDCLHFVYQDRIQQLRELAQYVTEPTYPAEQADGDFAQATPAEQTADQNTEADPDVPSEALAQPEPVVTSESLPDPTVEAPGTEPTAQTPGTGGGDGGWLVFLLILGVIGAAISAFWGWLQRVVLRCPKCTKWFAGEELSSSSQSSVRYEMRTFEDVHKDRHGHRTGSTSRKRQVRVNVTETTTRYKCKICGNEWTLHTTS